MATSFRAASDSRVVVGLSGGVDSAVAAMLLQAEGYEVIGVYLKIPHASPLADSAKCVAEQLGVPLHAIDVHDVFTKNVIHYFVESYAAGLTPNPCIKCNETVKFSTLLAVADEVGARWVATGHYAGIERLENNASHVLLRGVDENKDQSYMLYRLPESILGRLLLPVGTLRKQQVRAMAEDSGLHIRHKGESQDICFIPDKDLTGFLAEYALPNNRGRVLHSDGRTLGWHEGYWRYTVGQRKGVGISGGQRLYVTAISAEENIVTLGGRDEMLTSRINVADLHFGGAFTSFDADAKPKRVSVKTRFERSDFWATLYARGDLVQVQFDHPQRKPAMGQSAVFYDGVRVLGGGIVVSSNESSSSESSS